MESLTILFIINLELEISFLYKWMTKGNKSLDEQDGDVGTQEAMEEEDT